MEILVHVCNGYNARSDWFVLGKDPPRMSSGIKAKLQYLHKMSDNWNPESYTVYIDFKDASNRAGAG